MQILRKITMGFDFNKNGIDDEEDLLIYEDINNEKQSGNTTAPAIVVGVIIFITILYFVFM